MTKKLLLRASAFALALFPMLASAQSVIGSKIVLTDSQYMPPVAIYCDDGTAHAVICASSEAAATSTAQLGSVTSSTAVATSGSVTIAAGVATVGPLVPQLGRSIRVLLKGTWAGTVFIGTSADSCTTINPLTIGGQAWASFTGNANEDVDTPHIAGIVYCARATINSGTLTYAVRQ